MELITKYAFQYYGTDWLAVAFMCVYLWRVGDKHRDAFIWGALSSVFFVALNILIDSPPGIVFNALFCVLHARALIQWSKAEKKPSTNSCPKCEYDLTGLSDRGQCPECGNHYALS
jgi:hypothetical protein